MLVPVPVPVPVCTQGGSGADPESSSVVKLDVEDGGMLFRVAVPVPPGGRAEPAPAVVSQNG